MRILVFHIVILIQQVLVQFIVMGKKEKEEKGLGILILTCQNIIASTLSLQMLDVRFKKAQLFTFSLHGLYLFYNSQDVDDFRNLPILLLITTAMLYLNLINSSELNEKYREKYEEAEKNKEKYRQTLEQLP